MDALEQCNACETAPMHHGCHMGYCTAGGGNHDRTTLRP